MNPLILWNLKIHLRDPCDPLEPFLSKAYAKFIDRSVNVTHPLGKSRGSVAQADEVGNLVAFLASDKAGFITGECIAIDGGRQCLGAR